MRRAIALIGLAACAPSYDGPVTVIARGDDGVYELQSREIAGFDPYRVSGPLGAAFKGGQVTTHGYRQGRPVAVQAMRQGDAWMPVDEDGLILWSFYEHVAASEADLAEHDHPLDPVWPVSIAFNPVSVYDFAAAENAAFATGLRTFLIMPDAVVGVPLAANDGVVRHELTHAWFEVLTTGTSGRPDPLADQPLWVNESSRALNEGFADASAALQLDDPLFLAPSLDLPEREVGRDGAVASAALYPQRESDDLQELLNLYDPYPLGTVYASLIWDLYEIEGDRWLALGQAAAAVQDWAAEAAWADPDRFVQLLLDRVDVASKSAACEAAHTRFPDLSLDGCSE